MEGFLKKFDLLGQSDIQDFLQIGENKSLKKGGFFLQEGEVCQKLAFVHSGVFRSYYLSKSLEEITYCLSFANTFITGYSSYITQTKSTICIQALTDAELFVVERADMDQLEKSNINWMQFSKLNAEMYYMKLESRVIQFQKESAEERYLSLMKNHSEFIHNIPLKYLASYLGISQRHLSRLRSKLTF